MQRNFRQNRQNRPKLSSHRCWITLLTKHFARLIFGKILSHIRQILRFYRYTDVKIRKIVKQCLKLVWSYLKVLNCTVNILDVKNFAHLKISDGFIFRHFFILIKIKTVRYFLHLYRNGNKESSPWKRLLFHRKPRKIRPEKIYFFWHTVQRSVKLLLIGWLFRAKIQIEQPIRELGI